jgi:cell wall-associated NlpC family hydrolase
MCIDFFDQNFGIKLPDFARPTNWDADKLDLIGMNLDATGFQVLPDEEWYNLRPGDVLATAIASSNPNHLVIYVGGNEIIHHLFFKHSCKETLRPLWRMATMYMLRHPDVPDLRPQLPDGQLEEILRARFPR